MKPILFNTDMVRALLEGRKTVTQRVEMLQEIDDEGVAAEGLEIGSPFYELWDSTIKKTDRAPYGWEVNPLVWVIEFERITREEALPHD